MYGSVIGSGAQSIVLANGNRAQKIYPAGFPLERVQREAEAQRIALENGVRTPKVYGVKCIEDRPMLVMERIRGLPLDEIMRRKPDMAPAMLSNIIQLQRRIHQIPFEGHPMFSDRARQSIQQLPIAAGKRLGLLSSLRCLPEQTTLCHGDFHPQNVMIDDDGPVVIDWVDASMGHPLADACQTYLLLLLHAPQLAEIYRSLWASAPTDGGHTMTDWLTPLAFARRALNRPDEPSLASLVDMPPEEP